MDHNKLKGMIKEKYGSYEKLGDEIGVSLQAISEIVSGRSRGATGRYAVAKALGLEVEEIWPSERVSAA